MDSLDDIEKMYKHELHQINLNYEIAFNKLYDTTLELLKVFITSQTSLVNSNELDETVNSQRKYAALKFQSFIINEQKEFLRKIQLKKTSRICLFSQRIFIVAIICTMFFVFPIYIFLKLLLK